jgi:hypothetical protein
MRVNRVVESTSADAVLFLDPGLLFGDDLLEQMVSAYQPLKRVSCVGIAIEGDPVPAPVEPLKRHDREALYAPHGAILVDRILYRATGGFDGQCRRYLEDLDFGWRLTLLGYRVRLVEAQCRRQPGHVPPGTGLEGHWHGWQSALRVMLKNLDDQSLPEVLPPDTLALFSIGGAIAEVTPPNSVLVSSANALAGAAAESALARDRVQRQRQRPDADIFGTFGRPQLPARPDVISAEIERRTALLLGVPVQG